MYSLEGFHIENYSEATAHITWFSHANLSPRVGAENHVDHDFHNYHLPFLGIHKSRGWLPNLNPSYLSLWQGRENVRRFNRENSLIFSLFLLFFFFFFLLLLWAPSSRSKPFILFGRLNMYLRSNSETWFLLDLKKLARYFQPMNLLCIH